MASFSGLYEYIAIPVCIPHAQVLLFHLSILKSECYICVLPVDRYVHMYAADCGGQKSASDPVELELKVVEGYLPNVGSRNCPLQWCTLNH